MRAELAELAHDVFFLHLSHRGLHEHRYMPPLFLEPRVAREELLRLNAVELELADAERQLKATLFRVNDPVQRDLPLPAMATFAKAFSSLARKTFKAALEEHETKEQERKDGIILIFSNLKNVSKCTNPPIWRHMTYRQSIEYNVSRYSQPAVLSTRWRSIALYNRIESTPPAPSGTRQSFASSTYLPPIHAYIHAAPCHSAECAAPCSPTRGCRRSKRRQKTPPACKDRTLPGALSRRPIPHMPTRDLLTSPRAPPSREKQVSPRTVVVKSKSPRTVVKSKSAKSTTSPTPANTPKKVTPKKVKSPEHSDDRFNRISEEERLSPLRIGSPMSEKSNSLVRFSSPLRSEKSTSPFSIKSPLRSEKSTSPLRIKSPLREEKSTSPLRIKSPLREESPRKRAEHEELRQEISNERATTALLVEQMEALQATNDELKAEVEQLQAGQLEMKQSAEREMLGEMATRVRAEAERALEKAEELWRVSKDNEQLRAANEQLKAGQARAMLEGTLLQAALRASEAVQHSLLEESTLAEAAVSHLQAALSSVCMQVGRETCTNDGRGGASIPNRHRTPAATSRHRAVFEYASGKHDVMLTGHLHEASGCALARILDAGISLGRGWPARSSATRGSIKGRHCGLTHVDPSPLRTEVPRVDQPHADGSARAAWEHVWDEEFQLLQEQRRLLQVRRESLARERSAE